MLGVGTAGAALATACSAARSGGSSGEAKVFHAAYPYDSPPKGNFNYLGGVTEQISMGYLFDLFMTPGATYLWQDQKYYYLLADDSSRMSPDGKTFTYVVRDGLKWSDGSPITGRDVYTTWLLRWANGHTVFEYVSDLVLADKMTVTFHIGTPAPIVEYYLLRERPVPHSVYGKWATRAEPMMKAGKQSSDKSVVSLAGEVGRFAPKTALVSGPFIIDYPKVASGQLTMLKNRHGYRADSVHFDQIKVYNGVTDSDVMPLMLDKSVDYATYGFSVPDEKSMQRVGYSILRPPRYSGEAVYINLRTLPEFRDVRARQALAHIIHRQKAGKLAMGDSGTGVVYMAGFSDLQVPQWLSSGDRGRLDRYDYDPGKAEQLLTAAGWSKKGGSWVTPQGKHARYDMTFQSGFVEGQSTSQSMEEDFGAFGIRLTLVGINPTEAQVDLQHGKFELMIYPWGSSSNPFPTDAFRAVLVDNNYPTVKPYRGIDFPMKQQTTAVGNVDLSKLVVQTGLGANLDAMRANVTKTALAFNELLPVVPIWEEFGNNPALSSRVTGWPDENDPLIKNSPYADNFTTILMYQGKLRPA